MTKIKLYEICSVKKKENGWQLRFGLKKILIEESQAIQLARDIGMSAQLAFIGKCGQYQGYGTVYRGFFQPNLKCKLKGDIIKGAVTIQQMVTQDHISTWRFKVALSPKLAEKVASIILNG